MPSQTTIVLWICFFLAIWGLIRRHRRLKEVEEMDREFRENLLRKAHARPLTDQEQDSLLELKSGKKHKPAPSPSPEAKEQKNYL